MSLAIFKIFAVLKLSKILNSLRACFNLYVHTEHTDQELMRTLSVCVRNWCAPLPYASVPYAHAQYVHQFSTDFKYSFCVHQHAHQKLMRALCKCVRKWCVRWAYESGTGAYTEHTRQVLTRAQSAVPSKHAEHTGQELIRLLSILSGTDALPVHIRISFSRICSA